MIHSLSPRTGALVAGAALGILALATGLYLTSRGDSAPSTPEPRGAGHLQEVAQHTSPDGSGRATGSTSAEELGRDSVERRALAAELRQAEVEELLANLLGDRWPAVRDSLGPVRLAALMDADLATLPSWDEVEEGVFHAGHIWIDARRGTWPGGLSDRWRDVDRLDFRREAFNRSGRTIDPDLDAHLRDLVRRYNERIDRLAREFWDEIAFAYNGKWQPDFIVPLPDPAGPGRDQASLELLGIPGQVPGVVLDVVAADQGWRVELPLTPTDAPSAAELLEAIRELERERLAKVRGAIEGR